MTFRLRQQRQNPIDSSSSSSSQQIPLPRGVIKSSHFGHAVTSWGLRQFDDALCGGLPLSSVTLLIEDQPTRFHVPFLSYVSAQGLQHGHAVAIVTCTHTMKTPYHILEQLPCPTTTTNSNYNQSIISSSKQTEKEKEIEKEKGTDMKIAWRYKQQSNLSSTITNSTISTNENRRTYTSDFDFSKPFPNHNPHSLPLSLIPFNRFNNNNNVYDSLLSDISRHMKNASSRHLLSRIIIHSLPLPPPSSSFHHHHHQNYQKFLTSLQTLSRIHGAVIVISTCSSSLTQQIPICIPDIILSVDTFGGKGTAVAGLGNEWLGVVIVKKTWRIAPTMPSLPGRGDVWVFKRGRRKYTMERATAAPDEQIDQTQLQEEEKKKKTTLHQEKQNTSSSSSSLISSVVCGSGPTSKDVEF